MSKNKVCAVCGGILKSNYYKYCSDKCKKVARSNRYKHKCEWCDVEFRSVNKKQRFCSKDCQTEWQRKSKEYKLMFGVDAESFKNKFENKFKNFKYHSEYTGSDDYFKMECIICGHVQEKNAQCLRHSDPKTFECDNCKKREQLIKTLKDKLKIIKYRKQQEKWNFRREEIKPEIERLKRIKRNHRYYKKCSECGRDFFTARTNSKTCSDRCQNKRNNKIKELRRRNKLKKNGRINYNISLDKLIERDNGVCQLCGQPVDTNDCYTSKEGHFIAKANYPSIDHIIPVAKGGTHTWDNIQLAHRRCNTIKSDNSTIEIEDKQLKIAF